MKKSITTATAALILIVFVALACSEGGDATGSEPESGADRASPERSSSEPEAENTPEEQEQAAEEPEEETPETAATGPERIRFKKGMSEGTISLPLSANEKRAYVVGVTWGQNFHIEVEDFRPIIKVLTTSKLTDIDQGDGYVEGLTTKNGDIVFEIANPTRNSITTTATISIYDKVY